MASTGCDNQPHGGVDFKHAHGIGDGFGGQGPADAFTGQAARIELARFAANESADGGQLFFEGGSDCVFHDFPGVMHPDFCFLRCVFQIGGFSSEHGLGNRTLMAVAAF